MLSFHREALLSFLNRHKIDIVELDTERVIHIVSVTSSKRITMAVMMELFQNMNGQIGLVRALNQTLPGLSELEL